MTLSSECESTGFGIVTKLCNVRIYRELEEVGGRRITSSCHNEPDNRFSQSVIQMARPKDLLIKSLSSKEYCGNKHISHHKV
jgi:hypothetical protein